MLRSRASSAKGEEGAQVTAAPGNRSPGNRWQLHGLRQGLAESARGLSNLSVPECECFHPEAAWARQALAGTSWAHVQESQVLEGRLSVLRGPQSPRALKFSTEEEWYIFA